MIRRSVAIACLATGVAGAQEKAEGPGAPPSWDPLTAPVSGPAPGEKSGGAADGMPAAIPVGPEHQRLHELVGVWDVETRTWFGPGRVVNGKGKQTCRIVLGGLALACEYASIGDQPPFMGHGLTTWNPLERKYESYWVDSLSHGGMAHGWGQWDEAAGTLTELLMGRDGAGRDYTLKQVTTRQSQDRRRVTFFDIRPDATEHRIMEFVYNRRL